MKEILAYKTMVQFLEERYRLLPTDALGGLLGDLQLLDDGEPADPAMKQEWEKAVAAVPRERDVTTIEPLRRAS